MKKVKQGLYTESEFKREIEASRLPSVAFVIRVLKGFSCSIQFYWACVIRFCDKNNTKKG